jgi:hypothetical protein
VPLAEDQHPVGDLSPGGEQAVQALQRQRAADMEEIGGEHGRRLGVQELPPGRVGIAPSLFQPRLNGSSVPAGALR